MKKYSFLFFSLLFLGIVISQNGVAQYTVLINFTGDSGSYSGYNAHGDLLLSGNTLFGMTEWGGNGFGNIFSVGTNGSNYTNMVSFTGDSGSFTGSIPGGTLHLSGDTLFGTTGGGGPNNYGVIFSVSTSGSNFTDLVKLTGSSGLYPGQFPAYISLIQSGNTLFGTTAHGGMYNDGVVFSVGTNGSNYTGVVNLTGLFGSYPGAYPYGSLIQSGNTLFGMTYEGGTYNGGIIYAVNDTGSNYKVLVNFSGVSGPYPGDYPNGSLILSGSTLYGMTLQGGTNSAGVIFSVDTNGSNYTVLVNFTGTSGSYPGANPAGSLLLSGNTLYGMTYQGGTNNDGVIFSVSANGSNYTDLVNFTGTSGSCPGMYPWGSLIISGDTLFGMTSAGGADSDGVIFRFIDTIVATSTKRLSVVSSMGLVYPNPSNGQLTVSYSLSGDGYVRFSLVDELGQIVYDNTEQKTAGNYNEQLNLESLATGIYTLRMQTNSGTTVRKVEMIKK